MFGSHERLLTYTRIVTSRPCCGILCKQFWRRSCPILIRPGLDPNYLTFWWYLFFENIIVWRYQHTTKNGEGSGSVVECLARGSSLTGVTALCPCARHINPSLVLVQRRKTSSDVTERLLTGTLRIISNKQTNKNNEKLHSMQKVNDTVSRKTLPDRQPNALSLEHGLVFVRELQSIIQ